METKVIIILDFLLILLDCLAVSALRRLLLDFLIGQRNRKNAIKIHSEQSLKDRITLSYVKLFLKQYVSQFRFHHRVYLILIISLLPQYAIVFTFNWLLKFNSRFLVYIFCGIKIFIIFAIRLQTDSLRTSIYAKKGRRR